MNKITASLSLSAALMLGVANLSTFTALGQDKDEKGSSLMKEGGADKAPSSSSARESAPGSEKSAQQKSEKSAEPKQKDTAADKQDDKDKKESASDQRNEKTGDKDSSKAKNADRQDDKPSNKQSETKSDQPPAKKADTAPAPKSDDSADSKKRDDNRNADANKSSDDNKQSTASDTAKAEKAKSADLSGDKKDRVKTSFKSEKVKEITNVNIDISVGRRLPRDWEYHSVPSAVIEIVPEYRGYRYVYVEDRYVIVDPNTYEVVYVLDDTGGGSASVGRSTGESGSARCSTDLTFTQEDRTFIYEKVHTQSASVRIGDLEIGASLPQDAKVETFPSEVTTRVTKLDSCRYVVVDDKVAVVDPNDDKIVAIIED
jgi:hypothetical protein